MALRTGASTLARGVAATGLRRAAPAMGVAATRPLTTSHTHGVAPYPAVDPASLDWATLGFGYVPTKSTVLCEFKDGKWGPVTRSAEPYVKIHVLSNVLHYGQALFEGLKAFATPDGTVQLFRPDENAARMARGAERLGMPPVPKDLFLEACDAAVKDNAGYVPPFGTNGSLYLRPFYFGHGPKLGLGKAPLYTFGVSVSPVGNYYPQGIKPVKAAVLGGYDRAAPLGAGNVKAAGNYAPDVVPSAKASEMGFTVVLYLDAAKHEFVEEFSTSNFIAITKDGKKYVTPASNSILRSVTNLCLQDIAKSMGLEVEIRPIRFSEIGSSFSEVAACGTAVVITPISEIHDLRAASSSSPNGKVVKIGDGQSFPVMRRLYDKMRAIQNGVEKDEFGWCRKVCKRG